MVSKVLLAVGVVILVVVIYFLLPKDLLCPTSPNLKFTQTACNNLNLCPEEKQAYDTCVSTKGVLNCTNEEDVWSACLIKLMTTNVTSSEWIDQNTLRIMANGVVNCDAQVVCPRYEISGNSLVLKFGEAYNTPFMAAGCVCPHNMTYEISSLEHKDYQISIIKK